MVLFSFFIVLIGIRVALSTYFYTYFSTLLMYLAYAAQ